MPNPEFAGKDWVPWEGSKCNAENLQEVQCCISGGGSPARGREATTAEEYQLTSYDSKGDGVGNPMVSDSIWAFIIPITIMGPQSG